MVVAQEVAYTTENPEVVATPSRLTRISWGSVIAGVVIAIIIQVTLNMLGLAIGAGVLEPGEVQPNIGPAFGTGLVIWLSATTLLSIFAGGYVTSRLAGNPDTTDGMIHGLLTWGVGTLVALFLLSSTASNVFNGVASALGQGMALIGSSVSEVAPEVADALSLQESALTTIQEEVGSLPTEEDTSIGVELPIAVVELLREDSESEQAAETRQTVINLLTEQTTLTQSEAEAQVAQWEAEAQRLAVRVDETAEQAADDLADAIAKTAGILFAILVVGAFAGGAGGYIGAPEGIATVEVKS